MDVSGLVLLDLNGVHYMGTQEGEILVSTPRTQVLFPPGFPEPANPLAEIDISVAHMKSFLKLNATRLLNENANMSLEVALYISFLRLLAVKYGLISPAFLPANFNVDYTDAVRVSNNQRDAILGLPNAVTDAQIALALTAQAKDKLRLLFTDRVCLVAFVFRARAHHYYPDLQELYMRVWRKCRHNDADMLISHQDQAVTAFHGIYPAILDQFWVDAVANDRCNGALSKRIDVAPAGTAGPNVLSVGIADIQMVAPGFRERVQGQIRYLEECMTFLRAHRWNGSVNARYYGAQKRIFDEKRLGAIAATIYAAVNALADNAPIRDSPALQRIASNAPVTGAVLGRAIGQIATRPEIVDSLLIAPNE